MIIVFLIYMNYALLITGPLWLHWVRRNHTDRHNCHSQFFLYSLVVAERVNKTSYILSPQETDFLLRKSAQEQLSVSISSLSSLSQLLQTIGNIVITDDVGEKVNTSPHLLQELKQALF